MLFRQSKTTKPCLDELDFVWYRLVLRNRHLSVTATNVPDALVDFFENVIRNGPAVARKKHLSFRYSWLLLQPLDLNLGT